MAEPARVPAVPSGRGTLIALFAASVVFTLGDGSVQLLLAPHLQLQGVPPSVIGPIVAAYSGAALVGRFFTGAMYRADRIRWLVPLGCLLQAASFLVLAHAASPSLLAVATATNGMGFAIASTGGLAAVMELRPGANAGAVMGWYTGCIGAGYAMANFAGGLAGDLLGTSRAITALSVLPVAAALGLGAATRRVGDRSGPADPTGPSTGCGFSLAGLRSTSPYVWLAFFCALHINLLSGVLLTFFPLFALSIGLSLTQVGTLTGTSSAVSSALRFMTPAIFRHVPYRRFLPWMVVAGGLAAATLTISRLYLVLAGGWIVIGASRAILRVASAALVMDAAKESGQSRGRASGIYMSGLDVGKIIGPLLGGLSVERMGYGPTFVAAGVGVPLVFLLASAHLHRRHDLSV